MSEIVTKALSDKVARLETLLAFATSQHSTGRGDWKFVPQSDPELEKFEKNFNDPESPFFLRYDLLPSIEAQYALKEVEVDIRDTGEFPHIGFNYGAVVVPTDAILGTNPEEYGEDGGYLVGKPYVVVSTWSEKKDPQFQNANRRGRGADNALTPLGEIPFLPTRIDLTRPATDAEIKAVTKKLMEARGVDFALDVLKNLEAMYGSLL